MINLLCSAKIKFGFIIFFIIFNFITLKTEATNLPVTSHFGWRIHPIYGTWKFHSGVDLGYDYGTFVISLFDGTVISAGDYKDGYGNQVLIYHPSYDVYTRYAHLQAVYVSVGSQVSGGSYIGEVGSTGNSTGPHLHLEYIVRDANGNYVYTDPLCLF